MQGHALRVFCGAIPLLIRVRLLFWGCLKWRAHCRVRRSTSCPNCLVIGSLHLLPALPPLPILKRMPATQKPGPRMPGFLLPDGVALRAAYCLCASFRQSLMVACTALDHLISPPPLLACRSGFPSESHTMVFCGDYVDRGAQGVEVAFPRGLHPAASRNSGASLRPPSPSTNLGVVLPPGVSPLQYAWLCAVA